MKKTALSQAAFFLRLCARASKPVSTSIF